jgi:uncharacterized protein (TIGR00725 family)
LKGNAGFQLDMHAASENAKEVSPMNRKSNVLQISIVGSSAPDPETEALAESIGEIVASKGAVLICGGLGGVMEAAARGAKRREGTTVGILPDYEKGTANDYIDIVVPSGLGHGRNLLVAASGDLVVALPGSHGTRSEICFALLLGKQVVGLRSWGEIPGVRQVSSLDEVERTIVPIL